MKDLYNSLKELSRRELLGVWIEAKENNNKELEVLIEKVMGDTQIFYATQRQKRFGFKKKNKNKKR
mgnify:CR=1 FL=1